MSDFGDFNSPSLDPTADFLARERAILGDDADMFNQSPELPTSSHGSPVSQSNQASSSPYDNSPYAAAESGDNDLSAFNDNYPTEDNLVGSRALQKAMFPDEEPETVRQWRIKYKELIEERDRAAESKKDETLQRAREDIDRFYEEYNEKKQQAIDESKARQEQHERDREEASSANIWERALRECDLSDTKGARPSRDVSRMKKLMMDLQRDPKAPGTIVDA